MKTIHRKQRVAIQITMACLFLFFNFWGILDRGEGLWERKLPVSAGRAETGIPALAEHTEAEKGLRYGIQREEGLSGRSVFGELSGLSSLTGIHEENRSLFGKSGSKQGMPTRRLYMAALLWLLTGLSAFFVRRMAFFAYYRSHTFYLIRFLYELYVRQGKDGKKSWIPKQASYKVKHAN